MFGRVAAQFVKGVEAKRSDVKVVVNQEKPRKGCFVVSVDGKPLVSLLDLPRPFKKLRELPVEETIAAVLSALK